MRRKYSKFNELLIFMRRIKILHIANDFAYSKVHSNLIQQLDKMGVEQIVYCPIRSKDEYGKNSFNSNITQIIYSLCIRSWYKFVYHYKRRVLYNDLKSKVDLSSIDVIHAATLFSDGGIAYKAYEEYGIPYVVAVRNTDINDFLPLMKHTYPAGRKILLNASRIYFISEGLKRLFEESSMIRPVFERIKDKFVLRPNGIESFWLSNIANTASTGHNVLYIGDFTPNKNVSRLIRAVDLVRRTTSYKDTSLVIVGGGRDKRGSVESLINKNLDFVEFKGKIFDKKELRAIMHECAVFAMPSIHETFGLVYLESLSQNLPVIYTKNQGIDGLFDDTIGVSVNPESIEEIISAICRIFDNPTHYNNHHVDFKQFDWTTIADSYYSDYNTIIQSK